MELVGNRFSVPRIFSMLAVSNSSFSLLMPSVNSRIPIFFINAALPEYSKTATRSSSGMLLSARTLETNIAICFSASESPAATAWLNAWTTVMRASPTFSFVGNRSTNSRAFSAKETAVWRICF